jgi:quinol monooxygenase YgiN
MSKYGLHGQLRSKEGSHQQLTDILLEASRVVSSAKGCRLYLISKDNQDKNAIWITEIWDTKEDHDNSLKLENVKATIMRAMPLIDGMPKKGQEFEVLGGLGID